MLSARSPSLKRTSVFLLAILSLVHAWSGLNTYAQTKNNSLPPKTVGAPQPAQLQIRYGTEGLPRAVIDMREAILDAVRSGNIEDLKTAIELNEMKPVFGDGPVADPFAWLRQASGDGEGREVLAALASILEQGYVTVPLGRDAENNLVYVWPHFAETGVKNLTPEREVELLRLVPPPAAKAMREGGRYTHWSIGIGADGVWHFLRK